MYHPLIFGYFSLRGVKGAARDPKRKSPSTSYSIQKMGELASFASLWWKAHPNLLEANYARDWGVTGGDFKVLYDSEGSFRQELRNIADCPLKKYSVVVPSMLKDIIRSLDSNDVACEDDNERNLETLRIIKAKIEAQDLQVFCTESIVLSYVDDIRDITNKLFVEAAKNIRVMENYTIGQESKARGPYKVRERKAI